MVITLMIEALMVLMTMIIGEWCYDYCYVED